jgi:hypothetical protein
MKKSILLFLIALNSPAGIGGSGGGVSKTWNEIFATDKYEVTGDTIAFQKGISTVYIPVYQTCLREIESNPILESQKEVYYHDLDSHNVKKEYFEKLTRYANEVNIDSSKKFELKVYQKTNRFAPKDESRTFKKVFQIPNCKE